MKTHKDRKTCLLEVWLLLTIDRKNHWCRKQEKLDLNESSSGLFLLNLSPVNLPSRSFRHRTVPPRHCLLGLFLALYSDLICAWECIMNLDSFPHLYPADQSSYPFLQSLFPVFQSFLLILSARPSPHPWSHSTLQCVLRDWPLGSRVK